jgi:hypothetical protein
MERFSKEKAPVMRMLPPFSFSEEEMASLLPTATTRQQETSAGSLRI